MLDVEQPLLAARRARSNDEVDVSYWGSEILRAFGLAQTASLAAANLDPDDKVEISTNGRVIIIAPVRTKRETDKFERGRELMHAKFAGAFHRLAK